ncbi:calcium/sodium antiporter [Chachezhania antarctica]|uniref:calcium/sodium antiporter n=1 Tax=Chachezhania antarctica TaxID=2340860 RepID=UPI000EADEEC3|nr:calcium/sodium antiporter [Chachezhania antarctica]|tara:strand:+ start:4384 stop:5337 length:954 start_codon:yes stop_codon:yes gene_type:complete
MMPWILAGVGLVVLLLAGDILVRGAVNLSLRLGVPALIVSLTIVAFGTSAPELLISIDAVLDDADGIAIGNVVGSNIANVLMVLGIPAIIRPLHTSECETRRNFVTMLLATGLFIGLSMTGVLTWISGLILLAGLAIMLADAFRTALAHKRAGEVVPEIEDAMEEADPDMPGWRIGLYLVIGLIGLPCGAGLLVENASIIARTYGVSEAAIGLTLVAIGTSLPELATTVMATIRRQADVALGNVIGSNMFNLLAIGGIASLFGDIDVDAEFLHYDLWVMLAASLVLVPFVFLGRDITRFWGIVLATLYAVYLVTVLI